MKILLDANVLFTAAYSPQGRAASLFELASSGRCELTTSHQGVDEARRNLRNKAPHACARLESLLELLSVVPEADQRLLAWAKQHDLPDYDAPILAAAYGSAAQLLVTGDRRHFGHLFGRKLGAILVVLPVDALAAVLAEIETR